MRRRSINYFSGESLLSVLLLSLMIQPVFSADLEEWDLMLEAYISFSSIEGDASIGRVTGVDVDVDFKTILENLELGAMLHAEAFHESNWGIIVDYGFMSLGSESTLPLDGVVDAKVRQGVFQSHLAYRLDLDNGMLDFYAGIRWWDNDVDVNINPAILPGTVSVDVGEDWVDLVVGARLYHPISDRWVLQLIGDIGGVTGADFTATLAAGLSIQMERKMDS